MGSAYAVQLETNACSVLRLRLHEVQVVHGNCDFYLCVCVSSHESLLFSLLQSTSEVRSGYDKGGETPLPVQVKESLLHMDGHSLVFVPSVLSVLGRDEKAESKKKAA